jgi:hypothetical protein
MRKKIYYTTPLCRMAMVPYPAPGGRAVGGEPDAACGVGWALVPTRYANEA